MPDVEATLPNGRLRSALTLATALLVVAIIVLIVDWQIKQAILREAKQARDALDRYERLYWNGSTKLAPDSDCAHGDTAPTSGSVVDGTAGMEETTDTAEDVGNAWSETPVQRVSLVRTGNRRLAVPEGD